MTKDDNMVRAAGPQDAEAVIAVAAASGLFGAEELDAFAPMIREGLAGGDAVWLVTGGLTGAAMAEAEVFADRVWNLRFIAVMPDLRRSGTGRQLLRAAEAAVRAKGARMLLVETDGAEAFAGVRAFYCAVGYEEEARIRDFYGPEQDKVIFRRMI